MVGYLTPDEHPCNFGIGVSTAVRRSTNVSRTRNRRLSTRKFSGHEHEAAVYDERLAGRVGRSLRGEKGDPGGDLACVSGMSQGQVRTFDVSHLSPRSSHTRLAVPTLTERKNTAPSSGNPTVCLAIVDDLSRPQDVPDQTVGKNLVVAGLRFTTANHRAGYARWGFSLALQAGLQLDLHVTPQGIRNGAALLGLPGR